MPWIRKLNPRQEAFASRFERANVKYFYKVMTKTMLMEIVKGPFAYQLEFPLHFINAHAHEFDEHATFECKRLLRNSNKRLSVKITVRHFVADDKKRVFAYGDGGWRSFFLKNQMWMNQNHGIVANIDANIDMVHWSFILYVATEALWVCGVEKTCRAPGFIQRGSVEGTRQ